jgi:hypothetical protein
VSSSHEKTNQVTHPAASALRNLGENIAKPFRMHCRMTWQRYYKTEANKLQSPGRTDTESCQRMALYLLCARAVLALALASALRKPGEIIAKSLQMCCRMMRQARQRHFETLANKLQRPGEPIAKVHCCRSGLPVRRARSSAAPTTKCEL